MLSSLTLSTFLFLESSSSSSSKAASLDRLLDLITSDDDWDLNEQKAFIATYPSFTTPEVLLPKVIGLVRPPPHQPTTSSAALVLLSGVVLPPVHKSSMEGREEQGAGGDSRVLQSPAYILLL